MVSRGQSRVWFEATQFGRLMSGCIQVLDAYAKGLGEKKWALVGGRLDEGESRQGFMCNECQSNFLPLCA